MSSLTPLQSQVRFAVRVELTNGLLRLPHGGHVTFGSLKWLRGPIVSFCTQRRHSSSLALAEMSNRSCLTDNAYVCQNQQRKSREWLMRRL